MEVCTFWWDFELIAYILDALFAEGELVLNSIWDYW
jgi:hypothetical protein